MSQLHLAHDRTDEAYGVPTLVAQRHTHKTNPDEVLLTEWERTGEHAFLVRANWPRSHAFYTARNGLHDPMLLSETVRQALPLLSHVGYDIPLGHQLLWHDFRWELEPSALLVAGRTSEVELHVTCSELKYRRGRAASMLLTAHVYREGRALARTRTRFAIQDRAIYERLRGQYADIELANARALPPAPPVPAPAVGRSRAADVALSPVGRPNRWLLRVDTGHPILFDHRVDHVPGMLLLEASRQAAQAMAAPRSSVIVGMDSAFIRYAELDAPCRIHAHRYTADEAGRRRVLVTAHQHEAEIFTNIVTLVAAPQD
ncbi:ScbA/BarX family gamma-butyrolactone biosynthesis protein [Streptomyces roseicoloratus]|uniref:ScbA/BarX family gamma-butyrolactone biosynthesis protein n=1 Tax=Streptomyces roseicoloratus TaxID=2508722 RepID=A0ABY9RU32_9ACTN|nr:ScbA/BarX family gamma-butyrolactone biosynthesis protein [Streptomyces roseicoloratus]WMX45693.1 ScbA/BarX family gamma-butyrolactone biosynthesis protein [Streptomyces roseicoloratus]